MSDRDLYTVALDEIIELKAELAKRQWISVEDRLPEPNSDEEYEVWLGEPVEEGEFSNLRRMYAFYIEEVHPWKKDGSNHFIGWLDRHGNELKVTHYRYQSAPPQEPTDENISS